MDWGEADKNFGGGYYSPKKGEGDNLVLSDWRLEEHTHPKDDKPNMKAITFDVLKVNETEYEEGSLVWRSKSYRLYRAIKPFLLEAEAKQQAFVEVFVELGNDNNYRVVNLTKARSIAGTAKVFNRGW